jgi:transcriptional regulator with XRE-family HTH domain
MPGPTVLPVMTPKTYVPTNSFGEYFVDLMRAAGYERVNPLAKASGVSHANLKRWIDGVATPSVDALRAVAPYLGVRVGDLMVRAGLATREELGTVGAAPLPLPPVIKDILGLLGPRSSYTERDKRMLQAHLRESLTIFVELREQFASAPREPGMRRR